MTFSFFRTRPFNIYVKSRHGVRSIDYLQERTKDDVRWSIERIVYLNKGDSLYIFIPYEHLGLVSQKENVHIVGLFLI